MRPITRRRFLATSAGASLLARPSLGARAQRSPGQRLHYTRPAANWNEALPLGNGALGAMLFGRVAQERLQLNTDTLWAGGPYRPDNPDARAAIPRVRGLIDECRFAEAAELYRAALSKSGVDSNRVQLRLGMALHVKRKDRADGDDLQPFGAGGGKEGPVHRAGDAATLQFRRDFGVGDDDLARNPVVFEDGDEAVDLGFEAGKLAVFADGDVGTAHQDPSLSCRRRRIIDRDTAKEAPE